MTTEPLRALDEVIEKYRQLKRQAATDIRQAMEKAKREAEKAEAETKPEAES